MKIIHLFLERDDNKVNQGRSVGMEKRTLRGLGKREFQALRRGSSAATFTCESLPEALVLSRIGTVGKCRPQSLQVAQAGQQLLIIQSRQK